MPAPRFYQRFIFCLSAWVSRCSAQSTGPGNEIRVLCAATWLAPEIYSCIDSSGARLGARSICWCQTSSQRYIFLDLVTNRPVGNPPEDWVVDLAACFPCARLSDGKSATAILPPLFLQAQPVGFAARGPCRRRSLTSSPLASCV